MISTSLEKDFVNKVGSDLLLFKWKSDTVATCRCPYCGDSKKNKTKTRGHFFVTKNGGYRFKCFNCDVNDSLYDFLKQHNSSLADQMKMEFIKEKRFEDSFGGFTPKIVEKVAPLQVKSVTDIISQKCQKISELDSSHRARYYMESIRMMPKKSLDIIYYCDNFCELATQIDSSKTNLIKEPRIVFPLRTASGDLFGVSGRCIGTESDLRYITIRNKDYDGLKVYGMERYDPNKEGFLVEGALDSHFLPNCIAQVGAGSFPAKNMNLTVVYDNEPRSVEITKFMKRCLNSGMKVCIWGDEFSNFKDINSAIQAGWSETNIINHIRKNSYFGLKGIVKMASWKVCV